MPGRPMFRNSLAIIERHGEEGIWLAYLKHKTLKAMVTELIKDADVDMEIGVPTAIQAFYKWLDADESRRAKWAEVKKMRGDLAFDEVEELADSINEDNVRPTEAKIRAKQWIAERLNRSEYGKESAATNVTINVQHAWLGALKEAEQRAQAVHKADYEVITSGEDNDD